MKFRFSIVPALAALTALAGSPTQLHAQAYPNKPVKIIVPVTAGDTCDWLVRQVTEKIGDKLGQPFPAENRPGAGSMVGTAAIARSAPDGYTLGCGSSGGLIIVPHSIKDASYNPTKDFTPIALMARNFAAIVVGANSPYKSVADLVKAAKENPGKVTMGSNGEGGYLHFITERFAAAAGIKYLHVPFKGFPPILVELVGGRLDASFGSFPDMLAMAASGQVRILGVSRATRVPDKPDIPTIAETVPGYEAGGWFSIVGPAGIPKDIVTVLNREANAVLSNPEYKAKLASQGLETVNESPEDFAKLIANEYAVYGKLAKEIGIQPQ